MRGHSSRYLGLRVRTNASRRNITWLHERKRGRACAVCAEGHPACLQFHHREPHEKRANVSQLARRGVALETLQREVAKCVLLCANCHAKLHWSVVD